MGASSFPHVHLTLGPGPQHPAHILKPFVFCINISAQPSRKASEEAVAYKEHQIFVSWSGPFVLHGHVQPCPRQGAGQGV